MNRGRTPNQEEPKTGVRPHLFLMCPPEYFTVAYIINPWMHGNLRRIDNAVAKQQWRSLYDLITDYATVRLVLPQPSSPVPARTASILSSRASRVSVWTA